MAAAEVSLYGMNPMRFLTTKSQEERETMLAIARTAREVERKYDLERANQIASEVSKMFRVS